MPKDWMNNFVRVNGTGKADYGEYKPSEQTRSGRNTQRPQWYDILIQCTYHKQGSLLATGLRVLTALTLKAILVPAIPYKGPA